MDTQQQEKRLMAAGVFLNSVGLGEQLDNDTLENKDGNYEALDIFNVKRFFLFKPVDEQSYVSDSVFELIELTTTFFSSSNDRHIPVVYIWDLDLCKIILELNVR